MQRQPKQQHRKVIPRWRALNRTPGPELASASAKVGPLSAPPNFEFVEANWKTRPSVETAFELVSAGALGTVSDDVLEAADFLANRASATESLRDFGASFMPSSAEISSSDRNAIHKEIRVLKQQVAEFPSYAILNVELARRYASLGQDERAERFFRIAVGNAPDNRFVARSALRFFVHGDDLDKALPLLRRHYKSRDPWLLSAVIATADLSQKSELISVKLARDILQSGVNPSQITELASALATLELENGKRRPARKLFRLSEGTPNDNSVAQLRWADEFHSIGFDERLLETRLSFEARAVDAMEKEKWRAAVDHCELWRLDEPFSLRPTALAGYIAGEFLQDHELALVIAERGLVAHPNDAGLLNNKAFALSELGEVTKADATLVKAQSCSRSRETSIAILATEGHIAYRSRDPIAGAAAYQKAFDLAIELRRPSLIEQVFLHWIREEAFVVGLLPKVLRTQLLAHFGTGGRGTKSGKQLFRYVLQPILLEVPEGEFDEDGSWKRITSGAKAIVEDREN